MAVIRNLTAEIQRIGGFHKDFAHKSLAKVIYPLQPFAELQIDDGALDSPILRDLVERRVIEIVNVDNIPQIENDHDFRDLDVLARKVEGLIDGSIPPGSGGLSNQLLLVDQTSSEPNSSVTGLTSFVSKLVWTPGGSPFTGVYKLSWYSEHNHDKTNGSTEVQLLRTDLLTTLGETSERPTDTFTWNIFAGFVYITFSGATPSFDFQFRTTSTANTANLRRVRLELFEVT